MLPVRRDCAVQCSPLLFTVTSTTATQRRTRLAIILGTFVATAAAGRSLGPSSRAIFVVAPSAAERWIITLSVVGFTMAAKSCLLGFYMHFR